MSAKRQRRVGGARLQSPHGPRHPLADHRRRFSPRAPPPLSPTCHGCRTCRPKSHTLCRRAPARPSTPPWALSRSSARACRWADSAAAARRRPRRRRRCRSI
ncbi:hypothetical protein [Lysobacter gummosus]|uniref:hypothetical protein n=1 Tax=Lysobacter gummosus TaxID=262324 RepID=UPI0036429529